MSLLAGKQLHHGRAAAMIDGLSSASVQLRQIWYDHHKECLAKRCQHHRAGILVKLAGIVSEESLVVGFLEPRTERH